MGLDGGGLVKQEGQIEGGEAERYETRAGLGGQSRTVIRWVPQGWDEPPKNTLVTVLSLTQEVRARECQEPGRRMAGVGCGQKDGASLRLAADTLAACHILRPCFSPLTEGHGGLWDLQQGPKRDHQCFQRLRLPASWRERWLVLLMNLSCLISFHFCSGFNNTPEDKGMQAVCMDHGCYSGNMGCRATHEGGASRDGEETLGFYKETASDHPSKGRVPWDPVWYVWVIP